MKKYVKTRKNYQECLKLTSLEEEEFLCLLEVFKTLWEAYYERYDIKGNLRKQPKFTEDARSSLPGMENKLFFCLSYLKENPIQAYHGLTFDMSQDQVSTWLKSLLPIMAKSLAYLGLVPHREPCGLYKTLVILSKTLLWIDASE